MKIPPVLGLLLLPVLAAATELKRDIEYGRAGEVSLRLDASVPDGPGPFPVALLVHGGGWSRGDKAGSSTPGDSADITPWFGPLTAANFTWFSINYRLAPQHRWPACLDDVQTAIRWVKAHAAEFKGDPQRIALFGHSAGGQLVCLAAVLAGDDTRVQAVVGFAPVTNHEQDLAQRGGLSTSLQKLLDQPKEVTPGSRAILHETSAINHLKPGLPPFLLLHGDADKSVPYQQSLDFQAGLRAAGVTCDLITIKGAPHSLLAWDKFDPSYTEQLIAWLRSHLPDPAAGLPAFPGAEGFGSTTPGGRGGRVIFVTNLNDAGPGSFRAACEAGGPRMVIFRTGGTIQLKSPLTVKNPFLTVAGQTAPGGGICLRDYPFGVATHDVVVRYLRSRLGDESRQESDAIDAFHGARNVIFDHCSATWSVDECLSLSGDDANITVQWCLIGESLRQSVHKKGAHGYGSLSRANGPVSWHHNLWIHNDARNPRLGDNYGKGPTFPTFDVRNNVIYDYGAIASGLTQGRLRINYVANYIRPGPSSTAETPIHIGNKPVDSDITFFIRDNVLEGNDALTADNARFIDAYELEGKPQARTTTTPFATAPVHTLPAREALDAVLASVGASLPGRDPADSRLIADVRNRSGKMIDSQKDVGGWPVLPPGVAPVDSDNDGMPDDWEIAHGLNPADAADAARDDDHDGYSNLEEFLNGTDPHQFVDYRRAGMTP